MKFLLWALLVAVVVIWLMRGKKASGDAQQPTQAPDAGVDGEAMIRCAHCGTYVPASESFAAPSGAAYCSEEHRRLHAGT